MVQKKYQKAIREFVERALKSYGDRIESIVLFGSVARGDAGEDSDTDILVVWDGDKAKGWRLMTKLAFDILLDTEEYISIKVINSGDMNFENPFIRNVMRGIKIA